MDIVISQEPGQVPAKVMSFRGEFDFASQHEMETCAQKLIGAGARHLVIDLTGIPDLGQHWISAIDRVLLLLLDYHPRRDCELLGNGIRAGTFKSTHLKLLNPSPLAYQALHRVGADLYLEIYHDLGEAIASFGSGRTSENQADNLSQGPANPRWARLSVILSHLPGRQPSKFPDATSAQAAYRSV